MRTKSKKRNNFIHFKQRVKQRYGITVNRQEYNQLCLQIRNNRSICLGRQASSRTVHQVNLKGLKLIVIYNSNSNNIATTLYPGRSYRLR